MSRPVEKTFAGTTKTDGLQADDLEMFDSTSIEIIPPHPFLESLWRASEPNQNVSPANVFCGNPVVQPLLALWIHSKTQQSNVATGPPIHILSEDGYDHYGQSWLVLIFQAASRRATWYRLIIMATSVAKRTADGVFIKEFKAVEESKKLFCRGNVLIV